MAESLKFPEIPWVGITPDGEKTIRVKIDGVIYEKGRFWVAVPNAGGQAKFEIKLNGLDPIDLEAAIMAALVTDLSLLLDCAEFQRKFQFDHPE